MAAAAEEARRAIFWYDEDNLSADQKKQYVAFRSMLEQHDPPLLVPGLDDRLTLLRFLKARQWSPAKATKMYEAMAQWREEQNVAELMETFIYHEREEVKQFYPHFYHKTDKYGRPVYIELLGQANVDKLMGVTTMDRFLNYHLQACEVFRTEKLPACTAAAKRPILTTTIILDMEGFSSSHFTLQVKRFLEKLAKVDQDYYPGTMFIINAPFLFRSIWAFVKPFLDERTLIKIKVLGSSYKKELLELIPVANLLERFGGTSACDGYEDVGPWGSTLFERQATAGANLSEALAMAAEAAHADAAALQSGQLDVQTLSSGQNALSSGWNAEGGDRLLPMAPLLSQAQAWQKATDAAITAGKQGSKAAGFSLPAAPERSATSSASARPERAQSLGVMLSPSRKVSDCGSVYLTAASSVASELAISAHQHTTSSDGVVLLRASVDGGQHKGSTPDAAAATPGAAAAASPKAAARGGLLRLGSCCMAPPAVHVH